MALDIFAVLHIDGKEICTDNSYEYEGKRKESWAYYHPAIFTDMTHHAWDMFRLPMVIIMPTASEHGVTQTSFRLRSGYVLDKAALHHRVETENYTRRRDIWRNSLSGSDYFNRDYSEPKAYMHFVPYDLEDIMMELGEYWRTNTKKV